MRLSFSVRIKQWICSDISSDAVRNTNVVSISCEPTGYKCSASKKPEHVNEVRCDGSEIPYGAPVRRSFDLPWPRKFNKLHKPHKLFQHQSSAGYSDDRPPRESSSWSIQPHSLDLRSLPDCHR